MDFSDFSSDEHDFEDEEGLDAVDRVFNLLVRHGALELIGVDPDSHEPLYAITQKCKSILPELYEEMRSNVNEIVFDLWNRGIIDYRMGASSDGDMIRIAAYGPEEFERQRHELSREQVSFYFNLMDQHLRNPGNSFEDD